MLAWFKKKFGGQGVQEEPPSAVETEQAEQKQALSGDVPGLGESSPVEAAETATAGEAVASLPADPEILQEQPAETEAASEAAAVATETFSPPVPDTAAEDVPSPAPDEPPPAAAAHDNLGLRQERVALPKEAAAAAPLLAAEEEYDHDEAGDDIPAAGEKNDGEAQRPVSVFTQDKPAARSMFRRLQERLGKTHTAFVYQLDRLFLGEKEISQELFDQLEELLITADLGVSTTMALLDAARKRVKRDQLSDPQVLKGILKEEMLAYITASDQPAELVLPEKGPFVIMVVGVNGVGKTTTIGKIAAKFVRSGQSVLLIAGDTFRAAAIDQLKIWGKRVGVEVVAQKPGADPASVVFDGMDYGLARGVDVILIDTAGRLHTSVNLMEELRKIKRVIGRRLPGAPHEVLQVLDATTGQNGIAQAKLFHEAVDVSGLALTKLDGTAKGGIVANICRELKIPVRFIGIGEQLDDLRDFDAAEFIDALFAEKNR